jgi:hypothetical protein
MPAGLPQGAERARGTSRGPLHVAVTSNGMFCREWEGLKMKNDLRTLKIVHVAVMLHGDFRKDCGPLEIKGNFWDAIRHEKAAFSSRRTSHRIDFIE